MSNSLASQWIRPTFLDLVGASDVNSEAKSNSTSSRRPVKQRPHIAKPKAVQVIGSNEVMRTLTISDSFHSITVFLTNDAINTIKNSDNLPIAMRDNFNLETLNYSFIKLETYHYSLAMLAGADRDVCHFSNNKISLPIALNCNLLTFIGSNDVGVIGNPVDLNIEFHRENLFAKNELTFNVLVEKLGLKQFEKEKHLPAYDYKFKRATEYNNTDNQLSISHCIIPTDQLAILQNSEVIDIKMPRPIVKAPVITVTNATSIPILSPTSSIILSQPPPTPPAAAAATTIVTTKSIKNKKNKINDKKKKKKKKRERDADNDDLRKSKRIKDDKTGNKPSLQSLLGSLKK